MLGRAASTTPSFSNDSAVLGNLTNLLSFSANSSFSFLIAFFVVYLFVFALLILAFLLGQFFVQFLDCILCCVFVCLCFADSCLHVFDLAFRTFSLLLRIFGNILTECFVTRLSSLQLIIFPHVVVCSPNSPVRTFP